MFVRFRKLPCDGLGPDAASFEAARFLQVYAAYKENQQVTKRRMYLETMQTKRAAPVDEPPVRCRERLGGLLKYYHREAA